MSSETISVKRHNHIVHPCNNQHKEKLLNLLLKKNADKSILIVTSSEIEALKNLANENVSILSDDELIKKPELKCDILISYDLPATAIIYMVRLAHANTYAYILLDENEHKKLYPIETLLGRTLKQELVDGFVCDSIQKDEKKEFKPKKDNDRKSFNNKSKSKFLGKDENGKPIFSGKSGERNHRYDGTPKRNDEKVSTRRRKGKTINIKALKPKEESE